MPEPGTLPCRRSGAGDLAAAQEPLGIWISVSIRDVVALRPGPRMIPFATSSESARAMVEGSPGTSCSNTSTTMAPMPQRPSTKRKATGSVRGPRIEAAPSVRAPRPRAA